MLTEWDVLGVIIAIVGLFLTVGKPVISLMQSINTLNQTCASLDEAFKDFQRKNHESHTRIWEHAKRQDDVIQEHEERLIKIEAKCCKEK